MSNQLELRHLHYFLAVAEDLHFRKAAERLFISQPGLSRQIKEMEADIGVKLFIRDSRNVALTSAGVYLKEEIERNLKNLDHILQHARLLDQGKEGAIDLGYVGSAMNKLIPDLLVQFGEEFPKVVFSLTEMDNDQQIEGLLAGEIDLGFVRLDRVPQNLIKREILVEPFCLVLPEAHPIDSQNFKSVAQLKEASFILFDPKYSSSYFEKVMQIFDSHGFTPKLSHNTVHASSIYKLVEKGFGVSIVPKSLVTTHRPEIKFIELNQIPQRTTLSVVWDPQNKNPSLLKFLKILPTKC